MGAAESVALANQVEELEQQILEEKKKLAEMRKQLPAQPVDDYQFTAPDGSQVKLSQMFGDKDELLLIHNMGKSCPYCTLWADGFNGVRHHLSNRAAFVLVSPDDHETQRQFAQSRGWEFPMYSHKGTTFSKDVGFESEDGKQWPGFSTFRKSANGKIERVAKAFFGPGDDYCALWHLFDLLPNGVNGWEPKFQYE
jgi:predicted dithiol-disulfide oxidoreductase (DUF899 family)